MAGQDLQRPRVSAICTPAEVEVWEAESSYEQAGPRAGIPVPSQETTMALAARGDQPAASSLLVQTVRGGLPGGDDAEFIWRGSTDSNTTDWRGWDTPQAMSGWEAPIWTDGSGAVKSVADPCALTLDDGTVLVACQIRDTTYTGTTGEYRVEVVIRSQIAGTWSRVLVYGQDTSPTTAYRPCLVALPNGRLLLYHLRLDVAGTTASVVMWYSDDSGATWSWGGVASDVASAISTSTLTPRRMRAAYRDGQVCLIVSVEYVGAVTIRNRAWQLASSDLGNSLDFVELWTPTNAAGTDYAGGYFEVVSSDLGFVVGYVADSDVQIARLADAYTPLSLAPLVACAAPAGVVTYNAPGGTSTGAIADGDLALAVDDAGVIYAYARIITAGAGIAYYSADAGVTWSGLGRSVTYGGVGYWWHSATTSDYPAGYCATFHRGRMAILGGWVVGTGNEGSSLGCWYLGGYSSITMRTLGIARNRYDRVGWETTWAPIERPQDNGWTATGTAATEDLVSGYHSLSVSAANTRYYDLVPTMSPSQGLVCSFALQIDAGGTTSTNRIAVMLRYSDGVVGYGVDIRMSGTQYAVYDSTSGTQIGATQSLAINGGAEFLVGMYGDEVVVYHRVRSLLGDRLWIAGPSSTALTDAGAVTDYVRFGTVVTGAGTATTRWYDMRLAYGTRAGQPLTRASYPTDLQGRAYSSRWVFAAQGVYVSAFDGPTWIGDRWTISTRYDHELRRALDVGSPRITWRSLTTQQQRIAFTWRGDSGEDGHGETGILAIPVLGANVSQVEVALYDQDTTSWINVGTAQIVDGLNNLRASTSGTSSRPDSTDAANRPYLRAGEWIGATLRIDSSDARRIRYNTEGRWGAPSSSRIRPTITLIGADGTESASSTTAAIIPRDSVILVDLRGTAYSGVRLTIPTATGTVPQPAESYYEVGYLRPMWVHLIPQDPDWGQARTLEAATELVEARDLTRTSRVVGPPRRTIEVAWMDGVYQYDVEALGDGMPDYAHVSEERAAPAGMAWRLGSILRRVDGSDEPVLYIERIAESIPQVSVINRRDRLMLARIDGGVRVESAQGEPGIDEIARIAAVTLSEEV